MWWKALLALLVALALQVGVNYANDYSDGIRGTDADRVGPLRLVGSGVAQRRVRSRRAALLCFGRRRRRRPALAATTSWWLVAVGAAAIVAAWFYTGGAVPYGYRALGEVSVFLFFGLVAVVGTTYVQTQRFGLGAAGGRPSGWACWPARSWSPTTCATSRPTPWPASARSRSCSETARRGSSMRRCSPQPRWLSRRLPRR